MFHVISVRLALKTFVVHIALVAPCSHFSRVVMTRHQRTDPYASVRTRRVGI
jgi:hypothetical protein